ncbi:hypothetical protein SAMN05880558_112111 [Aeromonas sp. RU39B]|uniref:DUF2062 domain-containing protein n=1 Tax=Aeromonas sp. RU39B TaxID=1907416 RepID=UPI0009572AC0|nr:DUF2062 domain-containing protein [Aeromonas sp. RU39B]SIR37054.1 hypothetical protein SAMN05880558_112111 [Aeromonas sp. RU39B]
MQLKTFINRRLPNPERLRQHRVLRLFGPLMDAPYLWHLNRRSAAGALAIGIFCAWMPVPFQMLLAAAGAMLFRVNLPLCVALVWLNNPLTMLPLFYSAYALGAWLRTAPVQPFTMELSWSWLQHSLSSVGPSLLLGCIVLGIITALLGAVLLHQGWAVAVRRRWQRRHQA